VEDLVVHKVTVKSGKITKIAPAGGRRLTSIILIASRSAHYRRFLAGGFLAAAGRVGNTWL
jgi:hypothetical protein